MTTVVFDACVLYPAPMRDFLMELALTSLIDAKWTEDIQREWLENLLIKRPDLQRSRLENTIALMNRYVCDGLVYNYQHLIPDLELPDLNDRHVLAAAIHVQAQVILTFNLKDFPASRLDAYGIVAQHPDKFISNLLLQHPLAILSVVHACHERLKNPPKTMNEYLNTLVKQGLPQTVAIVQALEQSN